MKSAFILLLISSTLFQLKNVNLQFAQIISAIPFVSFIILSFLKSPDRFVRITVDKKLVTFLSLFLFLQFIAIIRFYLNGGSDLDSSMALISLVMVICIFATRIFCHAESDLTKLKIYVFGILLSIFIYVLINLSLYFVGIDRSIVEGANLNVAYGGKARMLSAMGFNVTRTEFLFSSGANNSAISTGALMVTGILLFTKLGAPGKRGIILGSMCFTAGLIGVLLADSRGAILMALIAPLAVFTGLRVSPRLLMLVPIIAPFVAILLPIALSLFSGTELLQDISRQRGTDLETLTGRTFIWEKGLKILSDFSFMHLFGFGQSGQWFSGKEFNLMRVSLEFHNATSVSMHNLYLQYLFNIGYIGLIIFVSLTYYCSKNLIILSLIAPSIRFDILLAILYYIIFYGSTAHTLQVQSGEFIVFIFIVIVSCFPIAKLKSYAYAKRKQQPINVAKGMYKPVQRSC